jgi:hypothetical protein
VTADHESRLAERRAAERARQGDVLVYVVARPLMFIAWALVLWGNAVALAALYVLVTRGPATAADLLLPRTPLGLVNAALAAVALLVWIAAIVVSSRRGSAAPAAGAAPRPR